MKYNRINEIEAYLQKTGSATNEELLEIFKISMQTLRRDLKELEDRKIVSKVYGGVVINEDESKRNPFNIDINSRTTSHLKEKEIIGELAAKVIQKNDIIFVDSGTTACHIIPYLDKTLNITVLTNSILAMEALKNCEGIKVILLGGEYQPRSMSFRFDSQNAHYYYTKAFISTVGLSLTKGLTNMDPLDGMLKHFIMSRSEEIYLLCDSSKIGCVAFNQFGNLDMIHVLVTDKQPEIRYMNYFKKHQIKVISL